MAKSSNKIDFYKHLRISVFIQAIMVFFPVGDEKVKTTSHLPSGKEKKEDFLDLKPLKQKNWKEEDIV